MAFWLPVAIIPLPFVGTVAWLVLYAMCAVMLTLLCALTRASLELTTWLEVLVYALLLSAVFLGADFGLAALQGSVKPRGHLPAFLNGLELYFVLAPGVASVAIGGLAHGLLSRWFATPLDRRRP